MRLSSSSQRGTDHDCSAMRACFAKEYFVSAITLSAVPFCHEQRYEKGGSYFLKNLCHRV